MKHPTTDVYDLNATLLYTQIYRFWYDTHNMERETLNGTQTYIRTHFTAATQRTQNAHIFKKKMK